MSDHETHEANLEAVGQRVHELTVQINDLTRARQRRQRVMTLLGIILAVSVTFSLMGVTNLGKQLDAETVAQIGRAELERRLPTARVEMQSYLEQEAPRLVGQSLHALLDLMPRMRVLLLRDILHKMDELNEDFERKAVMLMVDATQQTRADLDRARPDLGDREKLEWLVKSVSAKFQANIADATLALYPSYKTEMDRISNHLGKLQGQNPAALSEEEKVHKEILETLMQLVKASKQN